MVESIHTLRLSEKVVHILLNIEAVHENKSWRVPLFEQLLLKRIAVLSVVDDDFSICSTH